MPVSLSCLICKNPFLVKPSRLKKEPKYCSSKCYWQDISRVMKKVLGERTNNKLIVVKCEVCNKNFFRFPSQFKKHLFCSKQCADNFRKDKPSWNKGKSALWAKNNKYNIGRTPWNKGKKFPEFSGKNHFAWKGGVYNKNRKIDMGRTKYRHWRIAVFERDKYTCIWCGTTKELTADHIKPYAFYPKLKYKLINGRTLCVDCHKKTETYGRKFVIMRV